MFGSGGARLRRVRIADPEVPGAVSAGVLGGGGLVGRVGPLVLRRRLLDLGGDVLGRGPVVDGEVACWLHHGKFCLATGEATLYPARRALNTFPVEVRGGAVWLLPTPRD